MLFRSVVESYGAVNTLLDKEVSDGRIPDLETAKLIKTWLERSLAHVKDLRQNFAQSRLQAHGKVAALEEAVAIAKRFVGDEQKKIEQLRTAVEQGRVVEEGGYARPPLSIKAQRLAAPPEAPTPSTSKKKKGKADGKNTR